MKWGAKRKTETVPVAAPEETKSKKELAEEAKAAAQARVTSL